MLEERIVLYNCEDHGEAFFIPKCPECGRYVKCDEYLLINGLGEMSTLPNGTCKKHGRINMLFQGWF